MLSKMATLLPNLTKFFTTENRGTNTQRTMYGTLDTLAWVDALQTDTSTTYQSQWKRMRHHSHLCHHHQPSLLNGNSAKEMVKCVGGWCGVRSKVSV